MESLVKNICTAVQSTTDLSKQQSQLTKLNSQLQNFQNINPQQQSTLKSKISLQETEIKQTTLLLKESIEEASGELKDACEGDMLGIMIELKKYCEGKIGEAVESVNLRIEPLFNQIQQLSNAEPMNVSSQLLDDILKTQKKQEKQIVQLSQTVQDQKERIDQLTAQTTKQNYNLETSVKQLSGGLLFNERKPFKNEVNGNVKRGHEMVDDKTEDGDGVDPTDQFIQQLLSSYHKLDQRVSTIKKEIRELVEEVKRNSVKITGVGLLDSKMYYQEMKEKLDEDSKKQKMAIRVLVHRVANMLNDVTGKE